MCTRENTEELEQTFGGGGGGGVHIYSILSQTVQSLHGIPTGANTEQLKVEQSYTLSVNLPGVLRSSGVFKCAKGDSESTHKYFSSSNVYMKNNHCNHQK